MADKFRDAARADAKAAFAAAFELGTSATTGKPMLPTEYLKRAGVPERYWHEAREEFETVTSTGAASTLGARWADRAVDSIDTDALLNAMVTGY